jgi:hypothetical protein
VKVLQIRRSGNRSMATMKRLIGNKRGDGLSDLWESCMCGVGVAGEGRSLSV